MCDIEQEYEKLKEYVTYNPKTGEFTQIKKPSGKPTLRHNIGCYDAQGYKRISIKHVSHLAHRVAFYFTYGYVPERVDHKDRDVRNNRIENLRAATAAQNAHNSVVMEGASGVRNVSWMKRRQRWRARFLLNNKEHVKIFKEKKDAETWVREAKVRLLGDFANYSTYKNNVLDYSI